MVTFEKFCRSKSVKKIDSEDAEAEKSNEEDVYNIILFRIKASKGISKWMDQLEVQWMLKNPFSLQTTLFPRKISVEEQN